MADPTREEFDAAAAKVAASAPPGLSQEQFFALVDKELAKGATPSDSTTPALATIHPAFQFAQRMVEGTATNPALPHAMSDIGAVAGGVGAAAHGQPYAIPSAMYGGSRAGYVGGKILQKVAAKAAPLMEAAAPYTQAASTLSGLTGVGDLAQIAEPARRDIGVMGVGPSVHVPGAHPALLNALFAAIMKRLQGQSSRPGPAHDYDLDMQ